MEVKVCRECRRLFSHWTGDSICPACKEKLEEKFHEVKEYIEENLGTSMAQVAKDCEISLSQIKAWIQEERIHLSDDREAYSTCEGCGQLIPAGKFCNACKMQLLGEVGNALKSGRTAKVIERPKKENPQMRFFDR